MIAINEDMSQEEKNKAKAEKVKIEECWKFRTKELSKYGFTKETCQALLLTSKSTAACVRYLLDKINFHFVLTRVLSSDKIESHFGALRQMMGGNFKGDAVSVMFATDKILRIGIAYTSVHCNVILEKEKQKSYELIRANGNTKKEAEDVLKSLPESLMIILEELKDSPSN